MATLIAVLLAASLAEAAEPPRTSIRVVTFNAAGIPLIHPRIGRRMPAAGAALAEAGADIVALQETWRNLDAAALAAASGLPHAARVPRLFAFRTGLTILSRWPILSKEESFFSSVRPSLRHVTQGETVPSKGFLRAVVATPWGELDVYAAHTLADYPEVRYHLLRLTELYELSEAILDRSRNRPFVVLGDLNAGRGDREYDLFLDLVGLRDVCEDAGRELCPDPRHSPRIDHVLVPASVPARGRTILDAPLAGVEPPLRFSDHDGFAADLPRALMSARARPDPVKRAAALRAVETTLSAAVERLAARKRRGAWIPLYGAFLSARYERQIVRLSAIRERALSAAVTR